MVFARQAAVEVLFSPADLQGIQTHAVMGPLEPVAALNLLLENTGFTARLNTAGKFVVRRSRSPTPAPSPTQPSRPGEPDNRSSALEEQDPVIKLATYLVTPSHYGLGDSKADRPVTLTSADLRPLPQIGEDLYRTINRLPGLSANDFSAKFLVRGAPNSEVLSRFDGVDLIEPFHLKDYDGALSIVDVETVGSIDLLTGGFTAPYGDRLAGVFQIETQATASAPLRTTLGLSITSMRATNQGQFADGKGSWLAAVRRGYIDLALELGGNEVKDSPTYYDISAKVQYRLNPNHTLSLHVLHAGDELKRSNNGRDPDLRSSYASSYLWGRWLGQWGEQVSSEAVLSVSELKWHRDGTGRYDEIPDDAYHPLSLQDERTFRVLGLRNDWTVNLAENALIQSGFEIKTGAARYDYDLSRVRYTITGGTLGTETLARSIHCRPDGEQGGAYIAPRLRLGERFVVEAGLRFDRNSWAGDSGWSPRFNAVYQAGRSALRASWGVYRQAHPLYGLSVGDGESSFLPSEKAEQCVLGLSHVLASGVELRLEGYERSTTHRRPYWVNLTEPFNFFPETLYDRTRLAPSRGRARGVEILANRRKGGRFGWAASYTYAVNEDRINGRWMPRFWDQRHTFYADLTYAPNRHWQLSAAWQIHTGWPYTEQNFYLQNIANGAPVQNWYYGQTNALRTPRYHRLDLRVTRTYRFQKGTLRAFLDIWNAYDRKNEAGYDDHYAYVSNGQLVVVKTPGKMLSLLPSAGLSWEF